jgi:LPXTG-motif cell wall-anchored protein
MSSPESALPVTGGAMTMVLAVVGLVMTGVGFITRRIARI